MNLEEGINELKNESDKVHKMNIKIIKSWINEYLLYFNAND